MSYEHESPICSPNMNKILKYTNNVNCVFEVGAYDGVDIQEIKKMFGDNCSIHAFEPDNEFYQILSKNYSSSNVICNQIALSNFDGKTKLIKVHDPLLTDEEQKNRHLWYKTAGSLFEINDTFSGYAQGRILKKEVDVNVTTIDSYCSKNNIKPDVLLIDTQGSEYQVLEGAKGVLNNVQVILAEWSRQELYKNQKYLSDIQELLNDYGFALAERIDLWQDFHGDAIFVNLKSLT